MNSEILNPILRGFNPDPSIIRVDDDFYVATSTFEWFPGVQIHHSRDLVNWQLLGQVLNRPSQLDMKGVPDSCGVWAPCLSYSQGRFYLVYSNVKCFDSPWKDTPNFLVTAENIQGPWTDPVFLTGRGFDASLFHDKDGSKWLVNMLVDHRQGKFFGGIQLQQWDVEKQQLVGEIYPIFEGTELGCTEGPHLYQANGYYYLLLAEGGTEYGHAVTIARAKNITGPYELHPNNPIITARHTPNAEFQRTGHADLVETTKGDWYAVYLASRPLMPERRCTLGRETVIEQIVWDNDWPYAATENKSTRRQVPGPGLTLHPFPATKARDDFTNLTLAPDWQSLRVPVTEDWLSLKQRPGFLRLRGRESLSSTHQQSLIARRLQAHSVDASCALEFKPEHFQHQAGLVCYYNTKHYFYCYLTAGAQPGCNALQLLGYNNNRVIEPEIPILEFSNSERIALKVEWRGNRLQFLYSLESDLGNWNRFGPVLDASILSDDYVREGGPIYSAAFTGSFIGLCCQDLDRQNIHADFDWFEYRELE